MSMYLAFIHLLLNIKINKNLKESSKRKLDVKGDRVLIERATRERRQERSMEHSFEVLSADNQGKRYRQEGAWRLVPPWKGRQCNQFRHTDSGGKGRHWSDNMHWEAWDLTGHELEKWDHKEKWDWKCWEQKSEGWILKKILEGEDKKEDQK